MLLKAELKFLNGQALDLGLKYAVCWLYVSFLQKKKHELKSFDSLLTILIG